MSIIIYRVFILPLLIIGAPILFIWNTPSLLGGEQIMFAFLISIFAFLIGGVGDSLLYQKESD